ncbi:MAG: M23 family metallopeptidase, partial [Calothrix sp. SM1_7_51]|nr:M23 family metallopeptidase [Calothrix sp. SM1_7_51]
CHMMGKVENFKGRRYMSEPQSGLQIWEGQVINAGSRIGRIGMTGRTTGPHLHWGLKYNSQNIDPALVLREMFAQQIANGRGRNVNAKKSSVTIEPLNIRD